MLAKADLTKLTNLNKPKVKVGDIIIIISTKR